MVKIGPNTTVFLEYDLYTKERELLESTDGDGKIAYMHGKGMMLEALEGQLEGQGAGDEFAVELSVDEAFGPRSEELVVTLPRKDFGDAGDINVGDEFQTHDTNGEPLVVAVTEITDEEITVDGNHPFAGQDVIFEIKVLEVRETTEEDIKNFSGEHHHEHGESCGCGHDHGDDDHECCGGTGGENCCSNK